MKLKHDFVTNSSSTSYVICVNPNHQIDLNVVKKCMEKWEYTEETKVVNNIKDLIISKEILYQSDNYELMFLSVAEYFKELNLCISTCEIQTGRNGSIVNIFPFYNKIKEEVEKK